jgi:hypothetical protein
VPKARDSVSPNTLNLLVECPRCFWLEMKRGVKRPPSPFSTLPTKFDSLIKAYCKPYRGQLELPPLLKAAGLIGRLIEVPVRRWQDPETGLFLTGLLDECLETPEGLAPLDHKTRGYPVREVYASYQLQLDAYGLLLQGNGLNISGTGVLVYYIPGTSGLEDGLKLDLEVKVLPINPANVQKWIATAREVLDSEVAPRPSATCPYCQWAQAAADM